MSASVGMRATSPGVSALALGALAFCALTASMHIHLDLPFTKDPDPVVVVDPAPPPPPPPTTSNPPQHADGFTPGPPLGPINTSGLGDPFPGLPLGGDGLGPVYITTPHWTRHPSDLELERYYPRRALEHSVEGEATLDCVVRITGALDCTVLSETPAGWGFGAAALLIAHDYAMSPATRNGVAVEGRYRMRAPFTLH